MLKKVLETLLVCALVLGTSLHAEDDSTVTTDQAASKEVLRVVDLFMDAVRRGNLNQAYYAYSSEEFRKKTKFIDFKAFIDRYQTLGLNKDVVVQNISHFDTVSVVTATVTSVNFKQNTVVIDVIFEVGHYRIYGIQVVPDAQSQQ